MRGSQKSDDGLDPEETASENVKKVQKFTFTQTKTIKGKRHQTFVSEIDFGNVDDDNSVVTYVKGHLKWKCSGKSGEPPVLMLQCFGQNMTDYTEIILGSYDYPQNPSEEFVTLPIDVQPEDVSGQWCLYV